MAYTPIYISQQDLQDAMSLATLLACTDDNHDRVPDPTVVSLILERAEGLVDSFIARSYGVPFTPVGAVARIIRMAAIDIAVALCFERHTDYVRGFGEAPRKERMDRAMAMLERIADADLLITEQQPAKTDLQKGGICGMPARPMYVQSADGTDNGGDF